MTCTADINLEEIQSNIPVFPAAEVDTAFLLIYTILHHSPTDNVHPRSRITSLCHLLHPGLHVTPQHSPIAEIFSVYNPLSTI